MFSLLGIFLRFRIVTSAALLVVVALLLFLTLGSLNASSGFSKIYLIAAPVNGTVVHVGYFLQCTGSFGSNGTLSCTSIDASSSSSMVGKFSHHTIRPYFVVMSLGMAVVAWLCSLVHTLVAKQGVAWMFVGVTLIAWLFLIVAAVWQEVAVHSAMVLADATKGTRASAMIWASFALVTVCLLMEVPAARRIQKSKADM